MGDSWLPVLIALVLIPALLVLAVPRRWLGWTVLFWLLSPLVAYAAAILWETLTRPPQAQWLANAFYGLAIISPLVILPWLGLCLVGFALGFALRRLLRRRPPAPMPVPTPIVAARLPPQPPAVEAAGWRSLHVGFARDGLTIAGRDIWAETWRPTGAQVHLPHPAHRDEIHRYEVYETGSPGFLARFAASELSNGVWGFYVPTRETELAHGSSANGAIRYEYSLGEMIGHRYDTIAAWALVRDGATGSVLFDGSAWLRSRVIPQEDGSLYLLLSLNGDDRLLRLDPVAMSFREVASGGPDRPLSELAAATEEMRLATRRPVPLRTRLAPDGLVRVDFEGQEWGNSHWVHSPRVIDLPSGRVVLDLWNTDWDATVDFIAPRCLRLGLRRYHEGGALTAELDLGRDTYRIVSEYGREAPLPEAPLAGLVAGLEESARRTVLASGHALPRPLVPPKPWAAWRTALVILVGALAGIGAIGALAYRAEQNEKARRPPVLDTVPRFEPPPRR